MIKRIELIVLYLVAFLQGAAWSVVPSFAEAMMSQHCQNLSPSSYGNLYLPLVISTIIVSNIAGFIGYYYGIKRLLVAGLALNVIALLTFSSVGFLAGGSAAIYPRLLIAQLILGAAIAFILTSLNVYASRLFPKYSASSITSFYASMSIGVAGAPFIFSLTHIFCSWWVHTLVLAVIFAALFLVARYLFLVEHGAYERIHVSKALSRFANIGWIFVLVGIIYGISESAMSYWAPVYLHNKFNFAPDLVDQGINFFWAAISVGLIIVALITRFFSARVVYTVLALIIAIAFVSLRFAPSFGNILYLFVLAGLGCSAFFSLTINFAEKKIPNLSELTSGMMVTAYFIGTSLSSYFLDDVAKFFNIEFATLFDLVALLILVGGFLTIRASMSKQELIK